MLKIVVAPNIVLSQKAKPIKKIQNSTLKLISQMEKTLIAAQDPIGVGLAAPQVGESLQIFIAKPTDNSKISTFINPEIIIARGDTTGRDPDSAHLRKTEGALAERTKEFASLRGVEGKVGAGPRANKQTTKLEGCLSLPNIWGEVKREPKIKLQYQLITNNHQLITKTDTFSGFMATIIQHEVDHLNGILFPKRVLEQKQILYKSHKDKEGKDIFEEIEI